MKRFAVSGTAAIRHSSSVEVNTSLTIVSAQTEEAAIGGEFKKLTAEHPNSKISILAVEVPKVKGDRLT